MAWVEKGLQRSLSFNPPDMGRVANHQTRLPKATSSLALNLNLETTSKSGGIITIQIRNNNKQYNRSVHKNYMVLYNTTGVL